ncbi:hypothetical protein ACFVU3_00625 [Streptomyces sp. NPDC058052]|uniref:hypothetical protein n=1 Tax=Streptomyces sp. NPDC058052 TaxID=3346316 RepID=UPI0036E9F84E
MSDEPQCPEALFNPVTGSLRRCVLGAHAGFDLTALHQTENGTQWRVCTEPKEGPEWAPPF